MNDYILSIVIATKNREKYCIETIKSILSIPSNEIEITISDNSESEELKFFVESLQNTNIKYKHDSAPISSIDNFNRAMDLATGEYVCLIGDDDTVLPVIVSAVKWAKKNHIDSLNSSNYIHYYWPGSITDAPSGSILIPTVKPILQQIDLASEFKRLIRNGIVNYTFYHLPKTYHGLVKRELLLKIKAKTGNVYGGLSPDIYSVITVSAVAENHYSTTIPLTIAGVCAKSTTADNFSGKHSGELKNIPHLKNRGNYSWDKHIPEYYSVSTIWGESGLKALSDIGSNELYNSFYVYPLIAQGILMNRKTILKLTISKSEELRKRTGVRFGNFWIKVILQMMILTFDKVYRVVNNRMNQSIIKRVDVVDIHAAVAILDEYNYELELQNLFNS